MTELKRIQTKEKRVSNLDGGQTVEVEVDEYTIRAETTEELLVTFRAVEQEERRY